MTDNHESPLLLFRRKPATDAEIAFHVRWCNIQFTADPRPRQRNTAEFVACGCTNVEYIKYWVLVDRFSLQRSSSSTMFNFSGFLLYVTICLKSLFFSTCAAIHCPLGYMKKIFAGLAVSAIWIYCCSMELDNTQLLCVSKVTVTLNIVTVEFRTIWKKTEIK